MAARGRYTLLRKIAAGGTGEVFLAQLEGSAGFKRLVVLKRVLPSLWANEAFRRGLVDEAHIAMGLHHSNIVQVIDLGLAAQQYFLAFELVDGWTLAQVLRRAKAAGVPIPLGVGLHIMAEVCRALGYAHSRTEHGVPLAIVHRDVSPQNVLLSEQGEVKLTDFGIARARTRLTTSAVGSVKGKPAYMSPEQATGQPLDARSDLFPIGTMIYQLATGELPFSAPTAVEEMTRVVTGKFVSPDTLRPGLPKELVKLISTALEKKPEQRFQSAEQLLEAIERLQRTVLEPAGMTELKAWLAALSAKDGEQPLSRQQPEQPQPATSPEPTELIELQDEDVQLITHPSEVLPGVVNLAPRSKRWLVGLVALAALIAGTLWGPLGARWNAAQPWPTRNEPTADAGPASPVATIVPAAREEPGVAAAGDAGDPVDEAPPSAPPLVAAAGPEAADSGPEPEAFAVPVPGPAPSKPPRRAAPEPVLADDRVSVQIDSEPSGAQVRIDRRLFGTTPIPLRLKIGVAFELVLSKPGYREQKVLHFVTRRTNQKVRVTLVKAR